MSPEIRRKILAAAFPDAGTAEVANVAIDKAEEILEARVGFQRRRQHALERYQVEVRSIDSLWAELQAKCGHPAVTHEVGGQPGESITRCDLCEAEV